MTESDMGTLQWTEISTVRAMCGLPLKDKKIFNDLMLGLNETMDQLVMTNIVPWYGDVLRREDSHILRRF